MKKKKTLIIIILVIGGVICFGGVFLAKGIDFPYSFSSLFSSEDITIENLEEIYGKDLSELKNLASPNEANITEKLLDSLISPSGEIQQNLSQTDIEKIIEEISKTKALEYVPKISEIDFNLSHDSSKEAVETYLASAFYILSKNSPIENFSEEDISSIDEFAQDLASGDERKIDEAIKDFQKIYLELERLELPPPALEIHKLGLELSLGITDLLEEFKFIKKDPMRVLLALKQMEQIKSKGAELGTELQRLIEEYEITLP